MHDLFDKSQTLYDKFQLLHRQSQIIFAPLEAMVDEGESVETMPPYKKQYFAGNLTDLVTTSLALIQALGFDFNHLLDQKIAREFNETHTDEVKKIIEERNKGSEALLRAAGSHVKKLVNP